MSSSIRLIRKELSELEDKDLVYTTSKVLRAAPILFWHLLGFDLSTYCQLETEENMNLDKF